MKGFHYLRDVTSLELNSERCIGCGRCIEVCPHQVFLLAEKRSVIGQRDDCMECGACQKNCPVNAISVAAGVGCATGLINDWLSEHNLRRRGGDCCS